MTQPRRTLVSLEDTPYYHCVTRCVRRAFLCGFDAASGRSFEHRRNWMRERLTRLSQVFAVDICAYALMSNHYHLVLKLCPERTSHWSDEEIIDRWRALFTGPLLVRRYRNGDALSEGEMREIHQIVEAWRSRLCDLSWFMRCLNEHIARRANQEDVVTGHFWEARFHSQALLDDVAMLQGMVYVDLNPVRAAMAYSVADSAYTAAQQRFRALMGIEEAQESHLPILAPLRNDNTQDDAGALPFDVNDYLELVDATGRCTLAGKSGFIDEHLPRLLQAQGINETAWLRHMQSGRGSARRALGSSQKMRRFAERMLRKWLHGIGQADALYPT